MAVALIKACHRLALMAAAYVLICHSSPTWARPTSVAACDPEVNSSIQRFSIEMKGLASSTTCDSGAFSAGNCQVAGIRVDQGCAGLPSSNLNELIRAIRDVRGSAGLGCVNEVNAPVARALLSVFQRNPAFTICCNRCQGPDLAPSAVDATACALTPPGRPLPNRPAFDPTASNTVVLNTSEAGGVFGQGLCATGGVPFPAMADPAQLAQAKSRALRGLILHEMLHAAGLSGAGGHQGTGHTCPESGAHLDERDFVADPVFGCQNLCFGVDPRQNSIACLACAEARADSPADTFEKYQELNRGNSNAQALSRRLREAQTRISADLSAAPTACQRLWSQSGDPGRRNYEVYKRGLRRFQELMFPENPRESVRSCIDRDLGSSRARSIARVTTFLNQCAAQVREFREACIGIRQASGCGEVYGTSLSQVNSDCRSISNAFTGRVTMLIRAFGAEDSEASRQLFEGFRCEDFVPSEQIACGNGAELLTSECANLFPGWGPKNSN